MSHVTCHVSHIKYVCHIYNVFFLFVFFWGGGVKLVDIVNKGSVIDKASPIMFSLFCRFFFTFYSLQTKLLLNLVLTSETAGKSILLYLCALVLLLYFILSLFFMLIASFKANHKVHSTNINVLLKSISYEVSSQ